ncbi:MAG: HAMP domain-containing sensor histidine kinase [Planctomycetaceae bacterium]
MTDHVEPTVEQKLEQLQLENAQLKQQLMQSQKMSSVGALAASITHEFNNILTTTINYAKMGLRHTDEATREKAFTKILNAGQRAAKITTGMLSYARNHNEQKEATDLVQLVEEVLVLVEKDLQIHRVNLETRFEGRPHASLNANQVQQVLLNLIVNARQAMEGGGRMVIGVITNQEANTAEISVKDSGSGIPADQLQKIFQPFFTTKKADARGQGGTGLGLSMCREVIEAHQGRIRVESKVGEGTTFTLRFPLIVVQGDGASNLRMHMAS